MPSHPDTITGLLEGIDPETQVLVAGEREYTGKRFVESVYRTANFLRHCGVHDGAHVEIVPTPAPETVFGILGTALLEGEVSFEPGASESPAVRLGPTDELDSAPIPPGCKPVGFGDPPENPSWAYFERAVWSENPFFPEVDPDPARPLLVDGGAQTSVRSLLSRAQGVAGRSDASGQLDAEDVVAVRTPFGSPAAIVGGILAPLLVDATIMFPDSGQVGTVALSDGPAPEPRRLDPSAFEDW